MRRTYEAPTLTLNGQVVKTTNASSAGPNEGGLQSIEPGGVGFYL